MNQVFLSGLALIIAFLLWSSKKQSIGSAFFKSQKESFSKDQLSSSSLVINKNSESQKSTSLNNKNSKPFSYKLSLSTLETKKQLTKLISSNPNDRLLAIQIARQWENKKALPFLRRGLKDSDSRVVIAAAAVISSFKGKNIKYQEKSQTSRPPRNVSLMR